MNQEKELILDNLKIKYIDKNTDSDEVFVFLHGWGSSYKLFSPIFNTLDSYIAFDFPKKLKKAWNLDDYVDFTKKVIDKKLKLKKINFVVHSFGGRVLVKMLNNYEFNNINKIICIGVPFTREYKSKEKIIYFLTKISKTIFSILPESINKKIRESWYKKIGVDDYLELEDEIMKKTFANIIDEDIYEYSKILIKYKTYFIWGKNDKSASLSGAKKIAEEIKAKIHIIETGNHFPFLEPTAKQFMNIFNKIIKEND